MNRENTIFTPARLVVGFVLFQMVVLTAVPTLVSTSPPLDVVEGWIWAPHWLLGTYKHPPMPAWFLQAAHMVLPGFIFPAYLLSQLALGLTYLFVYRTGRLFMQERQAAAGTLLLAGSYYFTLPTLEFNHNVLQMPFWAAIILVFAHIVRKPDRTRLWLLLGLLVGAGMYVKYSVAVLGVVVAVSGLVFPAVRAQFLGVRPYLSVLAALLVFAPHGIWLIDNDFMPLAYAARRSDEVASSAIQPIIALLVQFADHAPMLLLVLVTGVPALRTAVPEPVMRKDRLFLAIFTFAPMLLVTVAAFASASGLKHMWGMPMFTTAGLWLVATLGRDWSEGMLRRLACGAVAIVTIAALVVAVQSFRAQTHRPSRPFWPTGELAAQAKALWSAEVGGPLRIVSGSTWHAGLISIGLPERPVVITGGELVTSPWVSETDIRRYGVLHISDNPGMPVPDYCLSPGPVHTIAFSSPTVPKAYVVICPPSGDTP